MKIQIEKNGEWEDISEEQLRSMAREGTARPDTPIKRDGELCTASAIEGVGFAETPFSLWKKRLLAFFLAVWGWAAFAGKLLAGLAYEGAEKAVPVLHRLVDRLPGKESMKERGKGWITSKSILFILGIFLALLFVIVIPRGQGDSEELYRQALLYASGIDVEKNEKKAIENLTLAANMGHADAQRLLGVTYFNGEGKLEKDTEQALRWLKKSAENGNVEAQLFLGIQYLSGEGTSKNPEEAVRWIRQAAEKGNCDAQILMADCYARGTGVFQNSEESFKWTKKAAMQGDINAAIELALCYDDGYGIDRNEKEAAIWFRKAAEGGHVLGQLNLGLCYSSGKGVPQNPEEAYRWVSLAANQGDKTSIDIINRLKSEKNPVVENKKIPKKNEWIDDFYYPLSYSNKFARFHKRIYDIYGSDYNDNKSFQTTLSEIYIICNQHEFTEDRLLRILDMVVNECRKNKLRKEFIVTFLETSLLSEVGYRQSLKK